MTTAVSGLPFDTLEHLDVNVADLSASLKLIFVVILPIIDNHNC